MRFPPETWTTLKHCDSRLQNSPVFGRANAKRLVLRAKVQARTWGRRHPEDREATTSNHLIYPSPIPPPPDMLADLFTRFSRKPTTTESFWLYVENVTKID